jgi:hypothetical protein
MDGAPPTTWIGVVGLALVVIGQVLTFLIQQKRADARTSGLYAKIERKLGSDHKELVRALSIRPPPPDALCRSCEHTCEAHHEDGCSGTLESACDCEGFQALPRILRFERDDTPARPIPPRR